MGWFAADSVMTTLPIVVVQPTLEGRCAVRRTGEGRAVGPLAQHGANETLGFAVRSRRVRAGLRDAARG